VGGPPRKRRGVFRGATDHVRRVNQGEQKGSGTPLWSGETALRSRYWKGAGNLRQTGKGRIKPLSRTKLSDVSSKETQKWLDSSTRRRSDARTNVRSGGKNECPSHEQMGRGPGLRPAFRCENKGKDRGVEQRLLRRGKACLVDRKPVPLTAASQKRSGGLID